MPALQPPIKQEDGELNEDFDTEDESEFRRQSLGPDETIHAIEPSTRLDAKQCKYIKCLICEIHH
mgnify:CR=1 FL=1|jgi:hypothetical protein